MRIRILLAAVILTAFGFARAISYGNPADMQPRWSLAMSAEYSRQFIYTTIGTYNNQFTSQRLMCRLGYAFFKWMELYGCIGGADADFSGTVLGISADLNGSWEFTPGVGFRIKPPLKFSALGMRFHMLFDARYLYLRSSEDEIPPELTDWKIKGKVRINEFEGAGLVVGYYRRFNLSFYAGLATRYAWSEMVYSAILEGATRQVHQEQLLPLGVSIAPGETFFPHMIFPILGLNWHLGGNYVLCFETNLADMSELTELGPKIGFTVGMSHYR